MARIKWCLVYMRVGKQPLHLSMAQIDLEQIHFWIWWSLVVLVPLLLQRRASLVSVTFLETSAFMIPFRTTKTRYYLIQIPNARHRLLLEKAETGVCAFYRHVLCYANVSY